MSNRLVRSARRKLYIKRSRRGMQPGESQTHGKDKGFSCKASPSDRIFAKRSRSFKMPNYDSWTKQGGKNPGEITPKEAAK